MYTCNFDEETVVQTAMRSRASIRSPSIVWRGTSFGSGTTTFKHSRQ